MRVKCKFVIFPGKFFLCDVQTEMAIASGSENSVSLRHSPRRFYFREGNLVDFIYGIFTLTLRLRHVDSGIAVLPDNSCLDALTYALNCVDKLDRERGRRLQLRFTCTSLS